MKSGNIVIVLLLFAICTPLLGQNSPIAILEKGPYLKDRLPIPMINYIKNWSGRYNYQGETIYVYYLLDPLPVPEYWKQTQCGGFEHFEIPEIEKFMLYTRLDEASGFVFMFEDENDFWCTFILTFLERFQYFKGVVVHNQEVPLPAILNLFQ